MNNVPKWWQGPGWYGLSMGRLIEVDTNSNERRDKTLLVESSGSNRFLMGTGDEMPRGADYVRWFHNPPED